MKYVNAVSKKFVISLFVLVSTGQFFAMGAKLPTCTPGLMV